jgi:ribosome-binding factor A
MAQGIDRPRRVGHLIQRELAEILREALRDEIPGLVSITGVDMSRDLRHATTYVSLIGANDDGKALMDILKEHRYSLRSALSRSLNLRVTPEIHFRYDKTIEHGVRLSNLITQANAMRPNDDVDDGA